MGAKPSHISNTELVTEIDKGLSSAGLPKNKLNKLMKITEERLRCDSECQRKKDVAALKKKWLNSKDQYEKLPNEISVAEKKYYTLDKGEKFYRDKILKKKYDDHIHKYENTEQEKFRDVKIVNDSLLKNYASETIAESRIDQLYEDVSQKNKTLKKDIDIYYKKTFTDERKVYYEDEEINNLKYYRTIIKIIYFSLLVLYIIFGSFFTKDDYKNWKVWLLIVLYIALPFVLKYLINETIIWYDYLT